MQTTEQAIETIYSITSDNQTPEQERAVALAMAVYMYDLGLACTKVEDTEIVGCRGQWQGCAFMLECDVNMPALDPPATASCTTSVAMTFVDRRDAGSDSPAWEVEGRFFQGRFDRPYRVTRSIPKDTPLGDVAAALMLGDGEGHLSKGGL